MFEKNLKIAYLLDFYGNVLDDRTRSVMRAYYEDDLSLAEIAEGEGISRQGVRHIIKKAEEQLLFLEDKLHLSSDFADIREMTETLRGLRAELLAHPDEAIRKKSGDPLPRDRHNSLKGVVNYVSKFNRKTRKRVQAFP